MTYISLNYRPVCRSIWKKVVSWQIVWFYTRRRLTSARWSNNNNSLRVQVIISSESTENSTKVSNWLSIAWWVSTSDSTWCNGTPELEEGRIIKLGAQVVKWLSKHLIFEHVHENLHNLLLRCKKGPYWCQKRILGQVWPPKAWDSVVLWTRMGMVLEEEVIEGPIEGLWGCRKIHAWQCSV